MFDIERVREALKTEQKIRIFGKRLNVQSLNGIVAALQNNPNPEVELTLASANITRYGARTLATGLKMKPILIGLNLEDNQLGDEGTLAIAELLGPDLRLTWLKLNQNEICEMGALHLANTLKDNSTLTKLWLIGNNRIGDNGVIHIARGLKRNSTLQNLWLNNIGITHIGANAIAELLKNNSTLLTLDLSNNYYLGDEGAKVLADALTHSTSLQILYLYNTGITKVGVEAICNALELNFSPCILKLSDSEYIDTSLVQKLERLHNRNCDLRLQHYQCLSLLKLARSALERTGAIIEDQAAETIALNLQKIGYPPAETLLTEISLLRIRQLQLGDPAGCAAIILNKSRPPAAFSLALAECLIAENFSDETVLTPQEKWMLVLVLLRGLTTPEAQRYQSEAYYHVLAGKGGLPDFQSLAERVQCNAVMSLVDQQPPPATAKKIARYEQIVLTPTDLDKIAKPDAQLAEKFAARKKELFQKMLAAFSAENVVKRSLQNLTIPPWIDSDEIKTALVTFKKFIALSLENFKAVVNETQRVISIVAGGFSEEGEKPDFEKLDDALTEYQNSVAENNSAVMEFAAELETWVTEQKSLFSPRGPS